MIANYRLTSTPAPILSTTADNCYASVVMFFCNTHASNSDVVSVYAVPDGDTPSDNNIIVKNLTIDPTDTVEFDTEKIILDNGAKLYAASANETTSATISYMEV